MSGDQQLNLFDFESGATPTASDFDRDKIPTDARVPIPPGTYENLDEIAVHCNQCHRCVLGNNRTHAVIGRGNPQAAIMIVGEAPGQNEDEQGLPFVGKSGQLLDKILESVGLSTEREVYISNAIRCRPPENRTPTAPEIEACKPYLLEQIRLVDPKIILLTGATAVKSLLAEKQGISKIRGQWRECLGRLCMPIFHPAYLLRNPSLEPGKPKWLMWEDIREVRKKYDQLMSK
ncbi:MAG: uracil-DNA glycosylase [Lyngbya sp.]|nr:uracil-DNA glycosylase [Lyngbya sp.]